LLLLNGCLNQLLLETGVTGALIELLVLPKLGSAGVFVLLLLLRQASLLLPSCWSWPVCCPCGCLTNSSFSLFAGMRPENELTPCCEVNAVAMGTALL
jgi:hypothetical protein